MADVLATIRERVAEAPNRLLYSFLDSGGRETARLTRDGFFQRLILISGHLDALPGAAQGSESCSLIRPVLR